MDDKKPAITDDKGKVQLPPGVSKPFDPRAKLKIGGPPRPQAPMCTHDAPAIIQADTFEQCGLPCYTGACPRCGHQITLTAPGKHPCLGCGNWLHLQSTDGAAEAPDAGSVHAEYHRVAAEEKAKEAAAKEAAAPAASK